MGTRHLTCIFADGEMRVAQYGQWDGYPSGAGANILRQLRTMDMNKLKKRAIAAKQLTSEEVDKFWTDNGADGSGYVSLELSKKLGVKYPTLSRDTGSDVLGILYNSPPGLGISNQINFAADSLFCEWLWMIDLDKGVLECYRGFNTEPLGRGERFKDFKMEESEAGHRSKKYYPVKFHKSYPLTELPTDDELIADCEYPDEDSGE